jgi:stage II sporulation protein D
MRHWPTLAALSGALALAACGHPAPALPAAGAEPELRIGLADGASSVMVGGDGELFVTDDGNGQPIASIPAGERWSAVPEASGVALVRPDGSRTPAHPGISAVNVTENRFAMADGRRYRGRLSVVRSTGGLLLVNRVGLEGYLAGVIGLEMGPRRPDELQALVAQAIVSRTFAVRNRGRWEARGYDLTSDTRDQVYNGVGAETEQVWNALRASVGLVITYQGQLIEAYFHSTCGFRTAGVDEAFRSAQARPYLRSISDASGGGHYYCDISPKFRWREEWDGASLRTILTRTLPTLMPLGGDGLQRVTDVQVSKTSPSGRVAELRIVFAHGDVRIQGPDVRSILRPAADRLLQSTAFQLFVTKSGDEVSHLVAVGAGSGHGVGFCQWGAIGRARAGQAYARIVTTYFPGTTIEKLY